MNSKYVIEHLMGGYWNNSRLGLERMYALMDLLGNPQEKLRFVHVAGTNGKGSVCVMLSSILSAAGYKTGLFTSPHINSFHEHMQVDGVCINDERLVQLSGCVQEAAQRMDDPATEFEQIAAIAFLHFLESGCDIVVLEVGLGGRLDATNVIPAPDVAVITPISLDHMKELGDTVEQIAAEKAGIVKPKCSVVSNVQSPGVEHILRDVCTHRDSSVEFLNLKDIHIKSNTLDGVVFSYKSFEDLEIHLLGEFQVQNASVVIMAAEKLIPKGFHISESALREGLKNARWPARFEIMRKYPWVIADGGHNPQCMESLADNLSTYFPGKQITFVIGVMANKDYQSMFKSIIPFAKRIFTVTPDNPRALPAKELAECFRAMNVEDVQPCASVQEGMQFALESENTEGVICATGSFYMAGAIRQLFV